MAYCSKCGKETEDGIICCLECEEKQTDVENNTENEQNDKKTKKKGKLLKLISDNKDNAVKGAGNAVVQFVVKKGIFALLTSILSAVIVLFTQSSFEENYKDYFNDFLKKSEPRFMEVVQFFTDSANDLDRIDEIIQESGVQEDLKVLLKEAYSYSSEDADINRFHNQYIRVCEDMYDTFLVLQSFSDTNQAIYGGAGNIGNIDNIEGEQAQLLFPMYLSLYSEFNQTYIKLIDDLMIYSDMRSEMFQKYGINENEYEFLL